MRTHRSRMGEGLGHLFLNGGRQMTPMSFVLLVGAGWLVAATVLAVLIGKAIARGEDHDLPENVGLRDWQRITRERR